MKEEGPEHRNRTEVEVVYEVVIVLFCKAVLYFTDGVGNYIDCEVVIDNTFLVDCSAFGFGRDADSTKYIPFGLPEINNSHFYAIHAIWFSDGVPNLIVIVFPFRVISQIECLDFYLFVVTWFEPCNHRVIVSLTRDVLVSPLVILGFKPGHWLTPQRIGVVGQIISRVIVSSLLSHTQ